MIKLRKEQIRYKKLNRFTNIEEICILYMWLQEHQGPKWPIMIGFGCFRGLRISEICAINIYDFKTDEFQKMDAILSKSHILDTFPIIRGFSEMVKEYIMKNKHTFVDGYIFPYYTSRKLPYMSPKTMEAQMSSWRKKIGKKYPQFLDIAGYRKNGTPLYRFGWHALRRFFETEIYNKIEKVHVVKDIMRYKEERTVYTYLDSYQTWKNEEKILEDTFSTLFQKLSGVQRGQQQLTNYF